LRSVLVFPPQASPSYVPLGIASLAAFTRERLGHCQLATADVNLAAWALAATEAGACGALRFFRGEEGDFYDEGAYATQQTSWRAIEARLTRHGAALKRWLAHGQGEDEAVAFLDALVRDILATDPEQVGFSLFSLGQLLWAVGLTKRIRAAGSTAAVYFGGAACAAFRVEDLLAGCAEVDGVVVGEGEPAWFQLCQRQAHASVPGLVHRSGGGIEHNRPASVPALEWLPAPDFSPLPVSRYLNPSPVLPVLHSRGCRWRRCRFCAHNFSYAGYRAASASRCADELEDLGRRHGARHFYFADLYVDAARLEALAAELVSRRADLRFHVLGRPTADYTRERLGKIAAAGCAWVSWGVESGSQRLLDLAGKGTSVGVVETVLHDARSVGISNLMMMMFGLPGSADTELRKTFAFIERVYDSVDAMTASAFALFENTAFARRAARYGLEAGEPEVEFTVGGRPVRNRRLRFRERTADGSLRPPRGPVEAGEWQARRRWLGEVPFLEGVACEHYLLHVSRRASRGVRPPLAPRRKAA
jgi:hypothetical protein